MCRSRKLCSGELVEGHKQKRFTLSQHKLMNQLNYGLPREARVKVPGLHAVLRKEGGEEEWSEEGCEVQQGNNWTAAWWVREAERDVMRAAAGV